MATVPIEVYQFVTGALLGLSAFYLRRTVTLLDKLEGRSERHDRRITRLETLAGQPSPSGE